MAEKYCWRLLTVSWKGDTVWDGSFAANFARRHCQEREMETKHLFSNPFVFPFCAVRCRTLLAPAPRWNTMRRRFRGVACLLLQFTSVYDSQNMPHDRAKKSANREPQVPSRKFGAFYAQE